MKMNIHIWFNKCQLLIYMSVRKGRQRGANSARHNWAPNSQLALSSRPQHSQNLGSKPRGEGPGSQGRPCTPGCSSPETPPHWEKALDRGGACRLPWESLRNDRHCGLQGDPVPVEPRTLVLCGVRSSGSHPVCTEAPHQELSEVRGWSPKTARTRPSAAAVVHCGLASQGPVYVAGGLQSRPHPGSWCHSASLPCPLASPDSAQMSSTVTRLPPGLHTLKFMDCPPVATDHCPLLLCTLISEATGETSWSEDWEESQPRRRACLSLGDEPAPPGQLCRPPGHWWEGHQDAASSAPGLLHLEAGPRSATGLTACLCPPDKAGTFQDPTSPSEDVRRALSMPA